MTTPGGLAGLAKTVNGIGPAIQVIPNDATGNLGTPTTLVKDGHRAGLLMHPCTFHAENDFLPTDFKVGTAPYYGRILDEITAYLPTGIDGFFTHQADIGVLARDQFVAAH